jgi:exodeoxyribonuclease VII small subunit
MTDITFESALQRLEQVVDQLEAGNLGLEESLKVFEEGVSLARRCAKYLDEAEKRIELLTRAGRSARSRCRSSPTRTTTREHRSRGVHEGTRGRGRCRARARPAT